MVNGPDSRPLLADTEPRRMSASNPKRHFARAMPQSVIAFFGGLICLPITYRMTRDGNFAISLLIIAAVGILSAWLGIRYGTTNRRSLAIALAFALGAASSEAALFGYYYFTYGHNDPKLSVGIAVTLIEFGVIAALGAASAFVTVRVLRSWKLGRS